MENLIAWLLMAAVSLPISYLVARGCLGGLMSLMSGGTRCEGDGRPSGDPGLSGLSGLSYPSGGMRRDVL